MFLHLSVSHSVHGVGVSASGSVGCLLHPHSPGHPHPSGHPHPPWHPHSWTPPMDTQPPEDTPPDTHAHTPLDTHTPYPLDTHTPYPLDTHTPLTPLESPPPTPVKMAIEAGGRHPTGMHSSWQFFCHKLYTISLQAISFETSNLYYRRSLTFEEGMISMLKHRTWRVFFLEIKLKFQNFWKTENWIIVIHQKDTFCRDFFLCLILLSSCIQTN